MIRIERSLAALKSPRLRLALLAAGMFVSLATPAEAGCTGSGKEISWAPWHGVRLFACIHDPGLGFQSVSWGVENQTSEELSLTFVKVYTLTCGKEVRKTAHLTGIKSHGFVGGGNFSGDPDLNDAFFKEDCAPARKVASVAWRDLHLEKDPR
jgi:hypothetical protein